MSELKQKLAGLPKAPGCYLFKDESGEILYVGKAASLRSRVRSYFTKSADPSNKTRRLVKRITDLEWIVTDSELEALILECNLIKKHRPYYNVRLRDDKSYPYLCITTSEKFPRLMVTRRVRQDGNRYFGPFASAYAMRQTYNLLHRAFTLIPCGKVWSGEAVQRPCLYHHIGRCMAPCAGLADREAYLAVIEDVSAFLKGKGESLIDPLKEKMQAAAEALEFEKAAAVRDQIAHLEEALQRQKVVSADRNDEDVVAVVKDDRTALVQMFYVRGGKLVGQKSFMVDGAQDENPGLIVQEFLKQYYQTAPDVPDRILLPYEIEEMRIVQSWLRQKRGAGVEIKVPHRGEGAQLIEMAAQNAELSLNSLRQQMEESAESAAESLAELQEALDLAEPPTRIEAYDISNIQGTAPVGSMVVLEDGEPKKSEYRRFKIRWHPESPDDFAMMSEVITRRLKEALGGDEKWSRLPQLILIDGGKGQLSAAQEAMKKLGFEVPMIGLAKREELIYLPDRSEPIDLPRGSKALHLLQRIRDEAHRFALQYHRKVRDKRAVGSVLEEIPHVGAKRRRNLLRLFGSVERIRSASVEELASVPGMTRRVAEQILTYLNEA